jgi:CheY-like chemotaxis protein
MSSRRILLIDDEPDIREVARVSLEALAGWEVATAASGREGVALATVDPPDAVILDVMMPDLDGPGTLEVLRDQDATRSVPVVLMTAKAQPAEVRRLESLGVAGVISKPFDPMTLHERVAAVLGW